MKLSKDTLNTLKHFSKINHQIYLKKGARQAVLAGAQNRYAEKTLDTVFPVNFPVENLSSILKALTTFKDPELTFTKSKLTITGKLGSIIFKPYKHEQISQLTQGINFPDPDVEFEINSEQYQALLKGIKNSYEIYIKGNGKEITATSDENWRNGYTYKQPLGNTSKIFSHRFKAEYFDIPIDDYKISISKKGIAKIKSNTNDYTSYIAIEIPKK